jgi:hypothetical protein
MLSMIKTNEIFIPTFSRENLNELKCIDYVKIKYCKVEFILNFFF